MNADPDPLWVGLAQNQTSLTFHVDPRRNGRVVQGERRRGRVSHPVRLTGRAVGVPGARRPASASSSRTAEPGRQSRHVSRRRSSGTSRGPSSRSTRSASTASTPGVGSACGRSAAAFHVVIEIGLEQYVRGSPRCRPTGTPPRSRPRRSPPAPTGSVRRLRWGDAGENGDALTNDRKIACWCQLYSTVVDQNYVGYWPRTGCATSPGSRPSRPPPVGSSPIPKRHSSR
jgi:hypothetical protein